MLLEMFRTAYMVMFFTMAEYRPSQGVSHSCGVNNYSDGKVVRTNTIFVAFPLSS